MNAKRGIKLFSSQMKTDNNFHEYFDNKSSILLLIKLHNSIVIGAYSKEEFKSGCTGKDGFLFSLTRKEVFERIKGSSIAYDAQAIIFGKNELKIKSKSMNLFSNFGSYERNFHAGSKDIDYFIGNEDSRYVQMAIYEVWQIVSE